MSKLNKTALYKLRLDDDNHHGNMYIAYGELRNIDSKATPSECLKNIGRGFNTVAEAVTKGIEYSVLLNGKFTEIAADYHYQYREFKKCCEHTGKMDVFFTELPEECHTLYRNIAFKADTNTIAMEKSTMLELLPKISGTALRVILYVKCRCSKPTAPGGDTHIKNKTVEDNLSLSRRTVNRAFKELEEHGLLEEIRSNAASGTDGLVTFKLRKIKI